MSAVGFEQVSYSYAETSAPALDDVSFVLEAGEFCVLAGLSASGKSTLLRAASGLAPHFYGGKLSGRVTIAGLDTREHGPGETAELAGTLLQDPESQVVMGTVRAELAFPLENRGLAPGAVARGVEEAALALGIERLLDCAPEHLSGGELQRVALGAALAGRPQVVLLDEPTSQLDPVAGDELVWLLRRLNEEWGTTVLLAEHRLERCLGAADRVLALEAGHVAYDGDPRGFQAWAANHAPALQTPAARLLAGAGLGPPPTGVKDARATLRDRGLLAGRPADPEAAVASRRRADPSTRRSSRSWRRSRPPDGLALGLTGVWHELRDGPALLRGVHLSVGAGELVALMGRNGAGKSTLLRHAAGLLAPTKGRVRAAGRVALVLQNPGDYFLHDRVADELPRAELVAGGLEGLAERHPRDLSGGQRQRLALAILSSAERPTVVCLDEPTRGMDRAAKEAVAKSIRALAAQGAAALVATHDVEWAATFATRVVLLADGRVIADGAPGELLCGGWYFATETARILDGAGQALLADDGAKLLRARRGVEALA